LNDLQIFGAPSTNGVTRTTKSIIKKNSVLKTVDEIRKEKKLKKLDDKKSSKGSRRRVNFEDLQYVDNIDEFIRDEEQNYGKVSKLL
jgi:hypothetical protein